MSRQKMKMAPVDFINADCQGYLLKLDGRSKCWKTRFCLLSDAFLYLYVDKESESALGKYSITIWRLFFAIFCAKTERVQTMKFIKLTQMFGKLACAFSAML